ncbi:MAG: hypothetical protein GXN96_06470 [Aquificae bacterium]|nr:hypothetical protein [Aquificota bacterium]
MTAADLKEELDLLKQRRKNGELSPAEFYRELLKLLSQLTQELTDEEISEENVRKQIPLILAFLEEQISKYAERGN